MSGSFTDIIKVFSRGLGLKTLMSYAPPVIVAWVFFVLYLNDLWHTRRDDFTLVLLLGLAGIALGSVIVIVLTLSIVPPLRRIAELTRDLRNNKTDMEIPYLQRHDEIGILANAVDDFRLAVKERVRLQTEQASMQHEMEQQKKTAVEKITNSFNTSFSHSLSGLVGALKQQESCAQNLRQAVTSSEQAVGEVSQAVTLTYESMMTISSATTELAASSEHIGQQTQQSRSIAEQAVESVKKTSQQAITLKEAAGKIGSVVALIGDIAGQTNLLALNATIEAARAGEVGKGFAVVANEVKVLANQTSNATQEITGQVAAIQNAIEAMVIDVEAIVFVIDQSLEISQVIASSVNEQMASTNKIADRVQSATDNSRKVEASVGTLGEAVQQVKSGAGEVSQAAQTCQQECATMQGDVARFVRGFAAQ